MTGTKFDAEKVARELNPDNRVALVDGRMTKHNWGFHSPLYEINSSAGFLATCHLLGSYGVQVADWLMKSKDPIAVEAVKAAKAAIAGREKVAADFAAAMAAKALAS